jgi:tRNA-modifying protein YgfZ
MLNGILTNRMPSAPTPAGGGLWRGEALHAALLTPKGRMISDVRILRVDSGEGEWFRLDLPAAGTPGATDYFARVLPPRMARVEDVEGSTGLLTVLGPEAPSWLAREALGLRLDASDLLEMPEGAMIQGGEGDGVVHLIRNGGFAAPAWDILADRGTIRALWNRGVATGARPVGRSVLETLRVEAGRPAFGQDLDDTTIPTEAGLDPRMVDHGKGCYTGQEVIVRIRDRGHVNRHLRGLLLGEGVAPAMGTELFVEGAARAVGRVTSAVESPRAGGVLGLGWVRREVEPPGPVRLGSPEGPPVGVRILPTGLHPGGISAVSWAF